MSCGVRDEWQSGRRTSRSRSREPISRTKQDHWWTSDSNQRTWKYDEASSSTPSRQLPVDEDERRTWSSSSWQTPQRRTPDDGISVVHRTERVMSLDKHGATWTQVSIPEKFNSTSEYWDERIVFDLPLPKQVFCTEWSTNAGIAGIPITSIPLYKVLFKGLSNWCLRHLGAGKACYMIMTRSYQQSILLYSLSKALRTIDVEKVAKAWNASLPQPTADVDERKLLENFGEHVAVILQKPVDKSLYERIQALESELAQCKATNLLPAKTSIINLLGGTTTPNVQQQVPVPPAPVGPIIPVFQKFERGTKPKHLGTDAPSNATTKDINAWAKKVLSPVQHKKIASMMSEVKESLKAITEDHTELVLRTVVDWGMPVATAGHVNLEGGIKILAVVTML